MSKTIAREYIKSRGKIINVDDYYLSKIDNVSDCYIMPKYGAKKLSDDELKTYIKYAGFTLTEAAGGFSGWATAQDELKKFGFKEIKIVRGHRAFVHLEWSSYDQ
jgi:hypothetical protein